MHSSSTATPPAHINGAVAHGERDQLAASVLRGLSRSLRGQFSMTPLGALGFGLLTLGLLPLFRLRRQFRAYRALEAQQTWHAAEWLRTRSGGTPSEALANEAKALRRPQRPWMWIIMTLCAFASIALFVPPLGEWHGVSDVVDRTYRLLRTPAIDRDPTVLTQFMFWNMALGAAYLLQWLDVALHLRKMRALAERFDAVAVREGVEPIDQPEQELGLSIPWIVGAAASCAFGAFWAIPLALAGASQRRYIDGTSAVLRAQMLERLRTMLEMRRPAVAVPNYPLHDRRCENVLCRALLRAGATFCPRCGAAVNGAAGTKRDNQVA